MSHSAGRAVGSVSVVDLVSDDEVEIVEPKPPAESRGPPRCGLNGRPSASGPRAGPSCRTASRKGVSKRSSDAIKPTGDAPSRKSPPEALPGVSLPPNKKSRSSTTTSNAPSHSSSGRRHETSGGIGRRLPKNQRRSKAPAAAPTAARQGRHAQAASAAGALPIINSKGELRQALQSVWLDHPGQKGLLEGWLLPGLLQIDPDTTSHYHLNFLHCPKDKVSLEGPMKGGAMLNSTPSAITAFEYDNVFLPSDINYNNGGRNTGFANCRRVCVKCNGKWKCIILIVVEITIMIRIANIVTAYVAVHLRVPVIYFNMGGGESRKVMKRFAEHENMHRIPDGLHVSFASGRRFRNYRNVIKQIKRVTEEVGKQSAAYATICRDVIFPRYIKLGIPIPPVPSLLDSLKQSESCPYVGDVNDKAFVDAALAVEREHLSALGTLGYERALEVTGLTASEFGKRGYDAVLEKNGWTRSEFGGVGYRAALEALNVTPSEFGRMGYRARVADMSLEEIKEMHRELGRLGYTGRVAGMSAEEITEMHGELGRLGYAGRVAGMSDEEITEMHQELGKLGNRGRVDKTMKEHGVDEAGAKTIIGQVGMAGRVDKTMKEHGVDDAGAKTIIGKAQYAGRVAKVMKTDGVDEAGAKKLIWQETRDARVAKKQRTEGVDEASAKTLIGQELYASARAKAKADPSSSNLQCAEVRAWQTNSKRMVTLTSIHPECGHSKEIGDEVYRKLVEDDSHVHTQWCSTCGKSRSGFWLHEVALQRMPKPYRCMHCQSTQLVENHKALWEKSRPGSYDSRKVTCMSCKTRKRFWEKDWEPVEE